MSIGSREEARRKHLLKMRKAVRNGTPLPSRFEFQDAVDRTKILLLGAWCTAVGLISSGLAYFGMKLVIEPCAKQNYRIEAQRKLGPQTLIECVQRTQWIMVVNWRL